MTALFLPWPVRRQPAACSLAQTTAKPQGAERGHWAFNPSRRSAIPQVQRLGWAHNPIDSFILAQLDATGLQPSPEADKTVLLRRVTLDLTGLPPTPEETDTFLADSSPDAYEKVVEHLLSSPRFGEHMARFWLDAARYGDTHGLHADYHREIWLYRDWVIRAFNDNKPHDRFLIEQIAGDLLPNASLDQKIATGFLRCHVSTSDGALAEEEARAANVADIAETTAAVTLGLTLGCARCHDHRYDPLTMRDYYSFAAFFNSIDGPAYNWAMSATPPALAVPTPQEMKAVATLRELIASLQQAIHTKAGKVRDDTPITDKTPPLAAETGEYVWFDDEPPGGVKFLHYGRAGATGQFVHAPEHPVLSGNDSLRQTALQEAFNTMPALRPALVVGPGDRLFAHVWLDPTNPPREIMLEWFADGWEHRAFWGEDLVARGKRDTASRRYLGPLPEAGRWVRLEVPAETVGIVPGSAVTGLSFFQYSGTVYWDRAGSMTRLPLGRTEFQTVAEWLRVQRALHGADLPAEIRVLVMSSNRTPGQSRLLRRYFIEHAWSKTRPEFAPLLHRLAEAERRLEAIEEHTARTLVFVERSQPQPAHILRRGQWDRPGEPVERATPAFLPPLPPDAPRNRLGLAAWLVGPQQPLTARVAVNRFWQQVFSTGLVRTPEDFGRRCEPPSHPQLLDWLAVEFADGGWDVKGLLRQIMISSAYRQSSRVTAEQLARDPSNRLLSRGPRFRLDAETIRDQALFAGGILAERMGGSGVKPPQPAGLWEAVGSPGSDTREFTPDTDHDRVHRRGLYTFWKRTSPPPQMSILDAPTREACVLRRERTNTPLQALLLMNEQQFIESARGMAERALRHGGSQTEQIVYLFRLAAVRHPDAEELTELESAYSGFRLRYVADLDAACQLISIGELPADPALPVDDLAALTMTANVILNLDEVLTRE